ncbi:hypothetical protein KDA11_06985 [Candidatus Saccharibacteria bacterium]|nr:hypothetical protein [Candidatus Saccharibacteria bacterium]
MDYLTFSLTRLAADACKPNFLGVLPPWYKYLTLEKDCSIKFDSTLMQNPTQLLLIGLGIIDILIRVSSLVAIGYVVYGGFLFVTSQGEPEGVKKARSSIINALIGLAISVSASGVVAFIAGRF